MIGDLIDEAAEKLREQPSRDEVALAVMKAKWLLAALCEASTRHGVAGPAQLASVIEICPKWFLMLALQPGGPGRRDGRHDPHVPAVPGGAGAGGEVEA